MKADNILIPHDVMNVMPTGEIIKATVLGVFDTFYVFKLGEGSNAKDIHVTKDIATSVFGEATKDLKPMSSFRISASDGLPIKADGEITITKGRHGAKNVSGGGCMEPLTRAQLRSLMSE